MHKINVFARYQDCFFWSVTDWKPSIPTGHCDLDLFECSRCCSLWRDRFSTYIKGLFRTNEKYLRRGRLLEFRMQQESIVYNRTRLAFERDF